MASPDEAGSPGRRAGATRLRAATLALTTGYTAAVFAAEAAQGGRFGSLILAHAQVFGGVWVFIGLILLAARMAFGQLGGERRSGWSVAAEFFGRRWRDDRWLSLLAPLVVLTMLMSSYGYFKQVVLPQAGFRAGPWLAAGEARLLGVDAWRITDALLPSPWASKVLDLAYHAWFLPMVLGVALCSFARPGAALADRYLFSFAMLWIVLGTALAYALPAAGPCYFHVFQADREHFQPLLETLQRQDAWLRSRGVDGLSALAIQEWLLAMFGSGQVAPGGGISAMPSLHNALATLFACAAFKLDRTLGRLMTAFAAMILIGSVHLGWHYLSDGVVAMAGTIAIWRFAGLLQRTGWPWSVIGRPAAEADTRGAPALDAA